MQKTIWVIDDDQGLLEVIQLLFKSEKLMGEFILQPTEIAQTLQKKPKPSLIFLDIYMQGINGIEICQELKNDQDTQSIPIILMSADTHLAEKAQQAKADSYLQKPFDGEEMITIIKSYLK